MAKKKKVPVTPVTPVTTEKAENQPVQVSSSVPQASCGGQSSVPQAPATPQKAQ